MRYLHLRRGNGERKVGADEGIEPIDSPDFEITSLEPVAFKATVPVRPTVELGDYKSIKIERAPDVAGAPGSWSLRERTVVGRASAGSSRKA